MARKKVLLFNPSFRETLIKDQYCSLTSKTGYLWPPIDLLVHSGDIANHHELLVLDAMAEKLSNEETMKRILKMAPDFILVQSSALSAKEDIELISTLKKSLRFKSLFLGDLFYFNAGILIKEDGIDALLMQFPAEGLLPYLAGQTVCADMVIKLEDGSISTGTLSTGVVNLNPPQFTYFPSQHYQIPFAKQWPFSPFITAFSCPMKCSYCPAQDRGYRLREMNSLKQELDHKKALGIKELFMADLMFNANPRHAKDICRMLIDHDSPFSWSALMRPDHFDLELLELMKKAGCHTISFGIESTNETILSSNKRKMNFDHIEKSFHTCELLGIKTLAILLIGLPGENRETLKASLQYVAKLKAHFLSVNIFVPRSGSRYAHVLGNEYDLKIHSLLDSVHPQQSYCDLPVEELLAFQKYAYRKFYFNFARIWRTLSSTSGLHELGRLCLNGTRLLFK